MYTDMFTNTQCILFPWGRPIQIVCYQLQFGIPNQVTVDGQVCPLFEE